MSNTYTSNTMAAKIWFFTWLVLSLALLVAILGNCRKEICPFIFLTAVIELFGSLPALVILLSYIEGSSTKIYTLPQKLLRLLSLQVLCCSLYGSITYFVAVDTGIGSFTAAGISIAVLFGCNCFSVLWNLEALKSYLYRAEVALNRPS